MGLTKLGCSLYSAMRLRTLGGLALPGVSFRRHKPLLLLTFLAIEGPKDRRYLAELFWPVASSPRQSLSVALSQLRQEAPAVVEADEARLWASVECDAVLLREAAAGRDWRGVVDLHAGPFLEGIDVDDGNVELEEWLYFTREMLAAQAQRGLIEVAASLVGREGELRDLQVRFEAGERLVTITGLGGVGKTALSVALAGRLLEGAVFDQVYFVPLEAIADPQEVVARIAAALTLPASAADALAGGARDDSLRPVPSFC